MTGHINMQKKAIISSLFLLVIIFCGAILFVAANEPANITHYEPDDFEYICHKKTIELRKELCLIDKVDDALVAIEPFNNEIKTVYISVQVTDDISSPEIDKISDYIGSCFEELDKSQLIVSYIDPLCNLICNYEY